MSASIPVFLYAERERRLRREKKTRQQRALQFRIRLELTVLSAGLFAGGAALFHLGIYLKVLL